MSSIGVLFVLLRQLASLAQLVEQLTRNEQVVGSSPMAGSIWKFLSRHSDVLS